MNNIKKLRFDRKWSQGKLASLVNTSPQLIQRIETGAQAARLQLAIDISAAFNEPIENVFPGMTYALGDFASEYDATKAMTDSKYKAIRKTGIEPDPKVYSIKVLLRGHKEYQYLKNIPAAEIDRIFHLMQSEPIDESECSFMVFESAESKIAINLRSISECQTVVESSEMALNAIEGEEDLALHNGFGDCAIMYFTDNPNPTYIEMDLETSNDDDYYNDGNHLNRAFYALDSGIPIHDKIFISDSNANDHLITAGDVSFLLAPHRMLESDTTECEEIGLEISGP